MSISRVGSESCRREKGQLTVVALRFGVVAQFVVSDREEVEAFSSPGRLCPVNVCGQAATVNF
jgi:hypothetical protein